MGVPGVFLSGATRAVDGTVRQLDLRSLRFNTKQLFVLNSIPLSVCTLSDMDECNI